MSVKRIVDAFEKVLFRVKCSTTTYTDEGRTYRMTMLIEWAHSLGRYGAADFSRSFQRHMAGPYSDAACDAMDEVFQELNIYNINDLLELAKVA